uniref:GRF-type domain-containing protein n=1 Tax=Hucho hucho TaxID=62062 RepID=A0A4W5R602_9TELE
MEFLVEEGCHIPPIEFQTLVESMPPVEFQTVEESMHPIEFQTVVECIPPGEFQTLVESMPPIEFQTPVESIPPIEFQTLVESMPPIEFQTPVESMPPIDLKHLMGITLFNLIDYLCSIVSDWDLGVCLLYECKRKQLHKPAVLNNWIDLRATYRLFYNRKPKGLNGALQDLGIQFSGREHSGLDDARNTAHLAWRMMRDGCLMKITRSLERVSGFLTNPHYYTPSTNDPTNSNLHATRSRPLTTKNPGNSFTSLSSTTNLPNPSFTRPKPVTTSSDSNLSASHTQTPNGFASNLSFARPRPVAHNPNPSTSRSRLHAETPSASFTIHKDSSSVARTSVGGSFSILSSSVNRSSFPSTRSTKITAPLCDCGRRAKRLTVCNGGPNQGRAFYCCAVRKPGPGGTRKGCELFKWESALLQAKSPASAAASIALCFGLNSSVVRPPVII